MTRAEALQEARRRWPSSNLQNAYETMEQLPGWGSALVPQCHVIAHNPFRAGRGGTWEQAFEDADRIARQELRDYEESR